LPEVAYDYVSRVRVEVAANSAATKPNSRLPQSTTPTERATFFNNIGHQLPRRLLVRAAAMTPTPDTKADDWGGYRATTHSLSR
jgi:hypothetical protein